MIKWIDRYVLTCRHFNVIELHICPWLSLTLRGYILNIGRVKKSIWHKNNSLFNWLHSPLLPFWEVYSQGESWFKVLNDSSDDWKYVLLLFNYLLQFLARIADIHLFPSESLYWPLSIESVYSVKAQSKLFIKSINMYLSSSLMSEEGGCLFDCLLTRFWVRESLMRKTFLRHVNA